MSFSYSKHPDSYFFPKGTELCSCFSFFTFLFQPQTVQSLYPKIITTQAHFLHTIECQDPEVSFVQTLLLRKEWVKRNHADRGCKGEILTRVNTAWDMFVTAVQTEYKNTCVDYSLLQELDAIQKN